MDTFTLYAQGHRERLNRGKFKTFIKFLLNFINLRQNQFQIINVSILIFPILGDYEYKEYLKKHPDFMVTHFLRDAAIPCKEALKRCSVNGRLLVNHHYRKT